ncbi:MAG: tyrosine-protein kinase [Actinomycetota bacterium]|jgi:capsular exopolysaccharide synthesis family protein|nr:tyrosine-protein kinase [Actinomycetota bacterium]
MADRDVLPQELDFREYLRVLKGRKWTIILVLLLTLGVALGLSYRQTPQYQASGRLLVKPLPSQPFPNIVTESQVVESSAVAEVVQEDLPTDVSITSLIGHLSVDPFRESQVNQSEVLTVSYVSTDPNFAAQATNSFMDSYIKFREDRALSGVRRTTSSVTSRMEDVRVDLEDVSGRIEAARNANDEASIAPLETERSVLSARLGVLQQRLDEAQASTLQISGGEVLEEAAVPGAPVSPNHTTNGVLGAFLGLFLGISIAFLREHLDDRFRSRDEVERAIEAPVLANVSKFPVPKGRKDNYLALVEDPAGAASESYRNMRTNLEFIVTQQGISSVLMTSPSAHEGKTVTTSNLAAAMATAGRRICIVSADLRRPTLEGYFGAEVNVGLSNWLQGEADENMPIVQRTKVPNVDIVTSGRIPKNPAELLTSVRLPQLLARLESEYDLVLVDSPPVLPVADAVIVASHVGGAILILNAVTTKRSPAIHAREQLERVGCQILGSVLNSIDLSAPSYYYQPYYYTGYRPDAYYGEGTIKSDHSRPAKRRPLSRRYRSKH